MLVIIVLLENEGAWVEMVILKCTQEGLLENGAVLLRVHDPIDVVKSPTPFKVMQPQTMTLPPPPSASSCSGPGTPPQPFYGIITFHLSQRD